MAAEPSFLKWPTNTPEPAGDEEFALLSELLERAFSKNARIAVATPQNDSDCESQNDFARGAF